MRSISHQPPTLQATHCRPSHRQRRNLRPLARVLPPPAVISTPVRLMLVPGIAAQRAITLAAKVAWRGRASLQAIMQLRIRTNQRNEKTSIVSELPSSPEQREGTRCGQQRCPRVQIMACYFPYCEVRQISLIWRELPPRRDTTS